MAEEKKTAPKRRVIDWEAIEKDYRAGIKSLRKMAEEYEVSHVAIKKRADKEGWPRDLQEKIKAAAEEKVNRAQVNAAWLPREVNAETKASERQVVEVNAEVLAQADLLNRRDIVLGIDTSRTQLEELAELTNPQYRDLLAQLADEFDGSTSTRRDQANELYRYIISLAGRVKMAKDVAATLGVYIPMQRKVLKLDVDADKSQSAVDELLARINASSD